MILDFRIYLIEYGEFGRFGKVVCLYDCIYFRFPVHKTVVWHVFHFICLETLGLDLYINNFRDCRAGCIIFDVMVCGMSDGYY